ncbi:MAG: 50S ribosomal protein L22 [Desulfovermiculus sp.]
MEVKARARYIRVSPRKTRLVADNIRSKPVENALNILKFTDKKPAQALYKVLYSAVANAENSSSLDVDSLYVKQVYVDEGPTWKRIKPRAMGRATRIRKRTSHITVIVDEL